MGKNVRRLLAAVFAAALAVGIFALVGCSSSNETSDSSSNSSEASAPSTQTVTDMVGRTVEVPGEVDKVIGVGASSLRMICYMQAADKVVGVEKSEQEDSVTCAYRHVNHDAFAKLPVIGEGGSKGVTANEEAIIAAAPQVIIANLDKDSADSLQQKTNIPVVCVTMSDIVFDQKLYDNITLLGKVLGKEGRGQELIGYVQDTEKDLQDRTANVQKKTAYAAGVSFRGGHGFSGTEAGFAPFSICNITNIADAGHDSGCFDIDLEAVTAAHPDYVFIEGGNLGLVKEDVAANPDYFTNLKAIKDGNVFSLVSYRFYATNVELAIANCYHVGSCVYPDQFSDIDSTKKLDEITTFFLGAPLSQDLMAEGLSFQKYDLMSM